MIKKKDKKTKRENKKIKREHKKITKNIKIKKQKIHTYKKLNFVIHRAKTSRYVYI